MTNVGNDVAKTAPYPVTPAIAMTTHNVDQLQQPEAQLSGGAVVSSASVMTPILHLFDLQRICCATSRATNPQQIRNRSSVV